MDTAVRPRIMRIEDFLAWECRQEDRYEFDGCEPVAMTGGTFRHAAIQGNLHLAVGGRLRGQACRYLGNDLKVLTAERVRYPDGQVVCNRPDGETTFTTTPVILFEVTSPSTATTDHVTKRAEYQTIPSVLHYVIVEQDRALVTVHTRAGEAWTTQALGPRDVLTLPCLALAVPVAELYEGVAVSPA